MERIDHPPTTGELLWLWRRRKRLSLLDASKLFGVTKADWVAWEADRKALAAAAAQAIENLEYTPAEELRLWRRRTKLGSRGAAAAFGVSHVSLLVLEESADQRLRAWYLKNAGRCESLYN